MRFNIFQVASYPPERCGIGTYTQDSITELQGIEGVNSVSVAAIDSSNKKITYNSPVDKRAIINAFDKSSWNRAAVAILDIANNREYPTCVILQHEFGLDKTSEKDAYQHMAKILKEVGSEKIVTLLNLHTVLRNPDEKQLRAMKDLSEIVDGITIPTLSSIEILTQEPYNFPQSKLKHIDHGIRMQDIGEINREDVRKKYGLEGRCLVLTLGLKSSGKGLDFGIKSYGRLMNTHFSKDSPERKKLVYLIAGEYHPSFAAQEPEEYKKCEEAIKKAIRSAGLKSIKITNLEKLTEAETEQNDIVIFEKFSDEFLLKELYAASDIVLLPYRNIEQISSGNLAEAFGFGKPVIATEFAYAKELLRPGNLSDAKKQLKKGKELDTRGIVVKLRGKYRNMPDIDGLTEGLDFLVFHEAARVVIGKNARQRGYEMSWPNVSRELVQYLGPILESRFILKSPPVIVRRDSDSKELEKKD